MTTSNSPKAGRLQDYLRELELRLSDGNHKRLLRAYSSEDPVASMEAELSKMLAEIMKRED